jgi:hypothetical protein
MTYSRGGATSTVAPVRPLGRPIAAPPRPNLARRFARLVGIVARGFVREGYKGLQHLGQSHCGLVPSIQRGHSRHSGRMPDDHSERAR